jgi:predicted secreted protein
MSIVTAIFIYFLVWWLTLFTVLPLGIERNTETGKGFDPGAPRNPGLKKKLMLNSAISFVIVAVLWLLSALHVVDWDAWMRSLGK